MYLLTQSKNSISTLEMARQLGERPDTASLMRHKLMSVMADREASRKLDGRVEMDDAVMVARKACWMAENKAAEGLIKPLSSRPSQPAMTAIP